MILVFGQTGQLARALQQAQPNALCLPRAQADLAIPGACDAAIRTHAPHAVINAAAYTAVDQAETDQTLCHQINAAAPTEMAQTCATLGIPFVHVSTEYVFDGAGDQPMGPDHPTAPLGVYGATKHAGEQGVTAAGGRFAILRTSWVFSAHGSNFVTTMLRLSETNDSLNVVADQVGGPTPADALARACLAIASQLGNDPSKSGIYHFSGAPDVSRADFARQIFQTAQRDVTATDIPSHAYSTPAKRPLNSRLDCDKTTETFQIARPDWRAALAKQINDTETKP